MAEKIKRILVLVAHPDDETIGLGGTIRKLSEQGCEVTVVFYTNGDEGFSDPELKKRIVEIRKAEVQKVQKILGFKNFEFVGYQDMALPNDKQALKKTIALIRKYKPEIIFTHSEIDKHRDHRALNTIAKEAFWQAGEAVSTDMGNSWKAKSLYFFEILDLIEPTHVCDISGNYETVEKAINIYVSQADVLPGVMQKIRALKSFRGAQIGKKYGEALVKYSKIPEEFV
ncbi:MAG: PIG-L family deacetylase [Candidatus Thermoplasmatota archaeon]|nr:PIG-L family deacetylase [Candidatus Thermoplasmatota archaeon]